MIEVIATVPFIPGHEAVGTVVKAGPTLMISTWSVASATRSSTLTLG